MKYAVCAARFAAQLQLQDGTAGSTFNLIESNKFKQLTHLSLRFRTGNDNAVKRFLAGRLANYKGALAELQSVYEIAQRRLEILERESAQHLQHITGLEQEHKHALRELQTEHTKETLEANKRAMTVLAEQRDTADQDMRKALASQSSELSELRQP